MSGHTYAIGALMATGTLSLVSVLYSARKESGRTLATRKRKQQRIVSEERNARTAPIDLCKVSQ